MCVWQAVGVRTCLSVSVPALMRACVSKGPCNRLHAVVFHPKEKLLSSFVVTLTLANGKPSLLSTVYLTLLLPLSLSPLFLSLSLTFSLASPPFIPLLFSLTCFRPPPPPPPSIQWGGFRHRLRGGRPCGWGEILAVQKQRLRQEPLGRRQPQELQVSTCCDSFWFHFPITVLMLLYS